MSNISRFASEIKLVHKEKHVNLKSIKSLMALEIRKGDCIKIFADGLDEEQAILEVEAVLKIASLVS